jgi:hypothetical protein
MRHRQKWFLGTLELDVCITGNVNLASERYAGNSCIAVLHGTYPGLFEYYSSSLPRNIDLIFSIHSRMLVLHDND